MLGNLLKWINPSQSSFDFSTKGLRHEMLGSQVLLALQQITDLSRQSQTLPVFLDATVRLLSDTTKFPQVAIELYHASAQTIEAIASTDTTSPKYTTFSLAQSDPTLEISKAVISSQKAQVSIRDPKGLSARVSVFPFSETHQTPIQTLIKVPMVAQQTLVGILCFAHDQALEDPEQMSLWGESLASYIGSLILNHQLENKRDRDSQRLQLMGEVIDGFSYEWNLSTGEIERQPDLSAAFNLSNPSELSHMDSWLQQIHPEDRQSVTDLFEAIWKLDSDYRLTYRICEQFDHVTEVSDQGIVLRSEQGEPIRVIGQIVKTQTSALASVENGSAARPEANGTQPASLSEDQQSRQMLNNIKTVIFNTDLAGHWVYLNPAWTALTGYNIEESMGESFIELVAPDDRQSTLDAFQSLLDGQTDFYSQEVRLITKSGAERWLSMEIQATLADDGQLIGTYGSFHDISDYKNTEAQLLQNALYDSLTGLPNRVLFLERLRHTYRSYRRNHNNLFTVFFLDVDSFKSINDTYGHLMGDKVLIEVAERLVGCLRPGDTTARLGGDEFTILLPQINAREDVAEIANRILTSLREPYIFGEVEIHTSATIGVAVCAHPYEQPEDLLRNADMALYQAKTSGKGQYVLFKQSMHASSASHQQMESDLRRVLENQDFEVAYQPIFNLKSESMTGLEAIIQWDSVSSESLQEDNLVDIAEQSGLSVAFGWKLLEAACHQLSLWHEQFQSPQMWLSVPLSVTQLKSPDLKAKVGNILSRHSFNPNRLRIDIMGGLELLEDTTLRSQLETLKSLGVSLCLNNVHRLSSDTELAEYGGRWIDMLKLDPVLIQEMEADNNLEILRTILAIGHKFRCKVLAPGIQSTAQLAQLRAFRCEYGQGELLADPMLPSLIEARWHELNQVVDEMSSSLNSPALMMTSDTQQSQLSLFGRQAWSIGRSNDSSIVLPDRWVSRHHAELQCMSNGDVFFVDLGSGNGSYVNGERVTMPVLLKKGDRLTVGQTDIDFIAALSNFRVEDEGGLTGLKGPKTVLMMQSSKLQGEVWREALTSQGISLIWLQPNVDLVQLLEQRAKSGQPLPDLLLLDMTIIKPNPYSFCRWCGQEYDHLNIILTSGSRAHVPPSERQWAINQGAKDLLPAFPERNLFGNMVDVVTNVKIVLTALDIEPTDQNSLSEVLMSLKTSMNRATLH